MIATAPKMYHCKLVIPTLGPFEEASVTEEVLEPVTEEVEKEPEIEYTGDPMYTFP